MWSIGVANKRFMICCAGGLSKANRSKKLDTIRLCLQLPKVPTCMVGIIKVINSTGIIVMHTSGGSMGVPGDGGGGGGGL